MAVRTLVRERRNGAEWRTSKDLLTQDESSSFSLKELAENHKELVGELVLAPGKDYKIETRVYLDGVIAMTYITCITSRTLLFELEGQSNES